MDKFDRIQQLHRLLRSHKYPVHIRKLAERMECSEKTVKRNIDTLRLQLQAPLEYDEARNGWFYDDKEGEKFELPGLWLTANELQSLGLLLSLLENIGPGLLHEELAPVEREIEKLLEVRDIKSSVFRERIKILPIAHRPLPSHCFDTVSEALLTGKQLEIAYTSYKQSNTERRISPQTLIHYRENWYLDAWCHLRHDLRTFHLSRITEVSLTAAKREIIDQPTLDNYFAASYGIFSGEAGQFARLRFDPAIAREISHQQWHPEQVGQWDGRDYLLTIPYSDDRELVQDILRHCPQVIVEAPPALRKKVQVRLQDALVRMMDK